MSISGRGASLVRGERLTHRPVRCLRYLAAPALVSGTRSAI
jgi:hypothetical protein